MKFNTAWRVGVCVTMAVSICGVSLCPVTAKPSTTQGAKVGSFQVPALSGEWRKRSFKGKTFANVKYSKDVQGTIVVVNFARWVMPKDAPATAQYLKELADGNDPYRAARAKQGVSYKTLESKPTRFRTHIAHLQHWSSYDKPKSKLVDQRNLQFIYQGDVYSLIVTLSGKRISSQAKAVADQAWQTMMQKLHL